MADEGREMENPEELKKNAGGKLNPEPTAEQEQKQDTATAEQVQPPVEAEEPSVEGAEMDEDALEESSEATEAESNAVDASPQSTSKEPYVPTFEVDKKADEANSEYVDNLEEENNLDMEAPSTNNMDNGAMLNLNAHKNAKSRSRFQQFIANVCGISDDKDMTKLNTLGSILWCGAKLGVACAVFGPLVGSWFIAHWNNHDYFAQKENTLFKYVNLMTSEDMIKGPGDRKYPNLGPRDSGHSR